MLVFEAATGKKLDVIVAKEKNRHKKRKDSYMVDTDAIKLMRKQLSDVGCKLHEVEADGNCLFRALGDQLYGDQHQHAQVRKNIVNYLEQHRSDFEPFMEDEEKFEKYCERMREDGTWGGNQELYAAARLFQVYVIVHQDQPSARIMVIECDRLKPTRIVHVAYHGDDHFDSVRAIRDLIEPETLPVSIQLDCEGFRTKDLAKRWQTTTSEDQVEQRVTPKAPTDMAEKLADGGASGKTLSKKEQRQLRKLQKQAKSTTRKLVSAPK
ncbi:OTU domain-containing protein 3 [Phytophthora citrophthora]|uniref:OTU domain-containing protein 3 n=1 Tax=Phytophthora citrophthora TaxID=4793 RepID=A0AAD9GPF7_9STRA|nr:OTU domain-containing protein 3 [Phytophthora citrophthora]